MRNVELKSRDPDPSRTLSWRWRSARATRARSLQRDTYFGGSRARVKLREQTPGDDELISYRRPDDGRGPRERLPAASPVPDADALREALDAAYGTRVVVAKRRRLLLWEDVRIHLDDVEGLGSYMELEALAPEESDLGPAHEKVARPARRARRSTTRTSSRAATRTSCSTAREPAARRRARRDAPRAYVPVLALPGRRRAAGRRRRHPCRRERRERRLPAEPVRGGVGDRGAWSRPARREITAIAVVAEHRRSARPAAAAASGCRSSPRPTRPSTSAATSTTHARRAAAAVVRRRRSWHEAAELLASAPPEPPRVGIVLGSGLGAVADAVEDAVVDPYEELPGFPRPTVAGHAGSAVLGRIGGVPVAILQGRAHLYEGGDLDADPRAGARAARGRAPRSSC